MTALLRLQSAGSVIFTKVVSMALVPEKQSHDHHLKRIPAVDAELHEINVVADTSNTLKIVNIVHPACHGIQDSEDATQSGLCPGDGHLKISNLIE
jgi:hypothetical protein